MNSQRSLIFFTLLVALTFYISHVQSCFITNCPPGGKRSQFSPYAKPCMKCGPGQVGQCFGPNICCGAGIGCQIDNSIARVCRQENQSRNLCKAQGTSCGQGGVCATDNICCSPDGCFEDKTCVNQNPPISLQELF